jgi:hypothetical protein
MPRPPTTLPERLAIARLYAQGHSEAQIAKALGVTPAACRESLRDARAVLEAHAVSFAADYATASGIAATKGDHRPARDMLDRLKVTEPTPTEQTTVGIAVQISGFTLPGLPVQVTSTGHLAQGAPAPALDVPLVPARIPETRA